MSAEVPCPRSVWELQEIQLHKMSILGMIRTRITRTSVKRHLRGRHLSVLNLKFDFISDGGCTREEQIALSLKRHLFLHGGREPKAFWICFSRVHPPSEIKSNFKFKTLKRHLLKRHLTLSELQQGHITCLFANWLPSQLGIQYTYTYVNHLSTFNLN